jgi:hypothetical protein
VLYDEYATCVELDGQLAHPAETRWRDIRRDNAVAAAGGATLRYGWMDVTGRACHTAAEVDRALRGRGFPGARPCGPACPVGVTAQLRPQGRAVVRLTADQRVRQGRRPASSSTRPDRGGTSRTTRVRASSGAD